MAADEVDLLATALTEDAGEAAEELVEASQ